MLERDFTVGEVPGVLWSPVAGAERAPLVLRGHGGGTHKELPRFEADSAVRFFVRHLGASVATPA